MSSEFISLFMFASMMLLLLTGQRVFGVIGFVGAAAGFSSLILHKGAGIAQERAGTSKPEYHCTYGDDPTDFEFIRLGINLYDQVGLSVTEAALKSSLGQFQTIVCSP